MQENKNHLLGYQIIDVHNETPEGFDSFDVMTMQLVDFWVKNFTARKDWLLRPIYAGDIEKPRLLDLEDPPVDLQVEEATELNVWEGIYR